MTYLQILNLIKDVALAQPNINSVVREFTDLNREDARYSAVVIQDRDGQREMINGQDYITYTWHLGYVDRLTYDESNRDDIYSTGMVVINNIVAELRERFFPELEVTVPDRFTTFNQRFTASCAGVYVVLAVNMAISDCADYQTDIYDKYQARFTEDGHYHYVPEGRPVDEIDIYVEVPECKEEIERTVTINRNGQTVVTPPEGNVFSVVTVNTSVHPSTSLSRTYTSNGTYSESGEYAGANITVAVPVKEEITRIVDIRTNGQTVVTPPEGNVFSEVTVNTSVHPSTSLSETYTSNGTYSISGEYNGGEVTVDVHPSTSLVETITSNGTVSYSGEWTDASITVDVHPTVSLSETYTSNGTYSISGEYNGGEVTVDVHPTVSLSETYTSNGTYNISGEYNGGEVTVSVPQKNEIQRTVTINMNGQTVITPPAGDVFSAVTVNTSVHPSSSLIETITSNGTVNYSGEWKDASITVDVHPSASLSETYTSNGTYSISGEYRDGEVTVDVHPSTSLVETITSNGTVSYSGEWSGAEITVAVSGAGKPEESLVQAITSNGSFHYDPTAGSVFSSADITVSVHPSSSLSVSYTSNGTYSISGEYNGGTVAVSVPTTSVLTVTQSQYDSILVKDSNTIYLING